MQYRRFGKTNLNISVFSLGTMRYLSSADQASQIMAKAVAGGVNHIETAIAYGQSERWLGRAIAQGVVGARKSLYITTKITPTIDTENIERQLEQSLQRLQTDYIDCLAIHGINTAEHLELVLKTANIWQKLLDDRRVRYLGFSTHASLPVVLSAINTDLFSFVNLHYYYFYQHLQRAIALASAKDLGILIISPSDKGGQLYTPPTTLVDLCQPFTPLELNYRFLLSDPRITTLTFGPATVEEFTALDYSDRTEPLTIQEQNIFAKLREQAANTLNLEQCHQCYECLPCPAVINIPEVLRLRNLAIAYDMVDFAKYRYRMFENAGHWFPGNKGNKCTECGDCLPRCPTQLDIPKLVQDTHQRLYDREGRRLWDS
jgi:predicted aldo/keto reductase-like oxidoreductase